MSARIISNKTHSLSSQHINMPVVHCSLILCGSGYRLWHVLVWPPTAGHPQTPATVPHFGWDICPAQSLRPSLMSSNTDHFPFVNSVKSNRLNMKGVVLCRLKERACLVIKEDHNQKEAAVILSAYSLCNTPLSSRLLFSPSLCCSRCD